MAIPISKLTSTALHAAERAQRIHQHDAHNGQADFECVLCEVLEQTVIACREAWRATDTAIIARETYANSEV